MKNLKLNLWVLAVCFSMLTIACNNEEMLKQSLLSETPGEETAVKSCLPQKLNIANFAYDEAKVNHEITFKWEAGSPLGNSQFKFEFLQNGKVVEEAKELRSNTHTLSVKLTINDVIEARVYENCGSGFDAAQTTGQITYLNAIGVDDIIFRAATDNSIIDLCSRDCNYVQFAEGSIFNSNGTVIDVSSLQSSHIFYDFSALRTQCMTCQADANGFSVGPVDPTVFIDCIGALPTALFDDYRECQ